MEFLLWFIVAVVLGLLACGVLVLILVLGLFAFHYDWAIVPSEKRAKRRIRDLVLQRGGGEAKIYSFHGATRSHLTMLIGTQTDAQAEKLRQDAGFITALRDALEKSGYPPESVPFVGFPIGSQETIDRDYAGSWPEYLENP